MTKTILFDFDGTIADTFEAAVKIINGLAEKYHFPPVTDDDLEELRTKSLHDIFKIFQIPIHKVPFIAIDIINHFRQDIQSLHPINHMPETLQQLKDKGYELSIITSNSEENVLAFLTKHSIHHFNHIYSSLSPFGKDKVITSFLKKYQLSASETLYVGDEIRDIEASHKAGVRIIAVTWGYNSEAGLKQYNPDYIANSPHELLDIVGANF